MGTVWTVVVAGGDGRRFGRQKQFAPLGGKLVVEWSIAAARSVSDGVALVVPANALGDPERHGGADRVVAGGATRSESVRAGLAAVPEDAEVIVVHDAARPLASASLFALVVAAVRGGNVGVIPAVPVSDTVKRVQDGTVVETLDRSALVTVQTPQAFRADVLRRAHDGAPEATDDAALLELLGEVVCVVPGEPQNRKLTDPEDLAFAEQRLLGAIEVAP